jgi:hypothetical protein
VSTLLITKLELLAILLIPLVTPSTLYVYTPALKFLGITQLPRKLTTLFEKFIGRSVLIKEMDVENDLPLVSVKLVNLLSIPNGCEATISNTIFKSESERSSSDFEVVKDSIVGISFA